MNKVKAYIKLLVICLLVTSSLHAQKGYELGGWLGTSFYHGDLNTSLSIQKPGISGGLMAKRNFNTRVSWRASFNFGIIGADDANSDNNFERSRNLSFRSNLFDFTTGVEFNFLEYIHGSSDYNYTPYLLAGFSIFNFNPTAELDGERYSLRRLGTEGQAPGDEYFTISSGFMIGAGFKWDITDDWNLGIEFTTRRLFTDYLDDVSTVYPDNGLIRSERGDVAADLSDRSLVDGIGVAGRQRGNSMNNDTYSFFGITLNKYFGGIECPKISAPR